MKEDYRLDIYATPINNSCGFIYMGYDRNVLLIGYTDNSISKRYGKTAIWGNWFGIDLQSFEGWRNIEKILNRAKKEARKKTSKGKQLRFEYEGELVNMGYKSYLTNDFNKMAEQLLIHICNRQFGQPLGRKQEFYRLPESKIIPRNMKTGMGYTTDRAMMINNILHNHFIPVWELMLKDVKTYNQPQHLIELYEEFYPQQKTA